MLRFIFDAIVSVLPTIRQKVSKTGEYLRSNQNSIAAEWRHDLLWAKSAETELTKNPLFMQWWWLRKKFLIFLVLIKLFTMNI